MKAIKEGRQPTPGPPGGTEMDHDMGVDTQEQNEIKPVNMNEEQNSTADNQPPTGGDTVMFPTTPTKVPEPTAGIPSAKILKSQKPVIPDLSTIEDSDDDETYNEQERRDILDASKLSRFAQSALQYDDVRTAIGNLEDALALLRPLRQFDQ